MIIPGHQLLEKNPQQLDQNPAESDLKAVERKERSRTLSSHIQLLVCFHCIVNVNNIRTFSETGQTILGPPPPLHTRTCKHTHTHKLSLFPLLTCMYEHNIHVLKKRKKFF